jgi:hypothetical protein
MSNGSKSIDAFEKGQPFAAVTVAIVSSVNPVGGVFLERIQLDLWFFFSQKFQEYQ